MTKVSVFYPAEEGSFFDMSYYLKTHIPMVKQALGDVLQTVEIEEGSSGREPDSPAAYMAIIHLSVSSEEAFRHRFGMHTDTLIADTPNYTNVRPIMQIGQIVLSR